MKKKPAEKPARPLEESAKPIPVVGVGASAGGLEAFSDLLKNLPSNTGMAFVLIQHLDPGHKSNLPSLLGRHTAMPVEAVTDKMPVNANHVYVLPAARELRISDGCLKLGDRPEEGPHRPINIFFDSLAGELGSRAMAVVLTGTAADGAEGLVRVKQESGITFAQDPANAPYPDMPRAAIATSDVDFILPPERIAEELARIGRHPYILGEEERAIAAERGSLRQVFRQLKTVSGIDFSDYKQATVARRMARRMALRQIDTLVDYAAFLQKDLAEAGALVRDLLINVTGFFREEAAFQTLKDTVFPALTRDRPNNAPLRIWTSGCATGEEAYTVGICLLEYLDENKLDWPVTIFATDVNEPLIEAARAGVYPESAVAGLSEERLARFFTKTAEGWRVIERLRDLCVFARQNLAADPPFSRLDLITCRNLLIYLGPTLQRKVLPTFQYALNPGGWLLLGGSESIGGSADLFETIDKKHKLYQKTPGRTDARLSGFGPAPGRGPADETGRRQNEKASEDLFDPEKAADRIILRKYPPAGFLVDESMRIIQFRGETGPYLQPSPGKASLNLVAMARVGLAKALRSAAAEAKKTGLTAAKGPARIDMDGDFRDVNIEVDPIKAPGGRFFFLVSCLDVTGRTAGEKPSGRARRAGRAEDRETVELRQELAALKEHLQAVIEEKEAANEELTAANEEIRASNEELQSVNEELQTATEELQASNEELSTVNDELQRSVEKERGARSEIDAVFSSLTDAVVVYGRDGRVLRANPAAIKAIGLDPVGLGLAAIYSALRPGRPDGRRMTVKEMPAARALRGERVIDETFTLTNAKGQKVTVLASGAPLFSRDKVSGAVVAWHDVTERERLVREIERSEALYRAIGEANLYGVWITDPDGNIVYLSQSFLDLIGKTLDQCREFGWTDRLPPEDVKRTAADWKRAVKKEECWDYEHRILGVDGKYRTILSRGVATRDDRGNVTNWVGINLDITERKEAERLAEAMNEINARVASTRDFKEMMERLATDGAKALGADACRIALLEEDHWVLRFTSGLPVKTKGRSFKRLEMPAANSAFETGQPVAVDDIHDDPRVNSKVMEEYGVRSLLAATLAVRNEPLGVIFFDYREPIKFQAAHVDFASKLAASVSLAMENARLFEAESLARRREEERATELETKNSVVEGINVILRQAVTGKTEEELGRACLAVVENVTQSKFSFIDEIGPDGLLHDIAISNPGWERCAMNDKSGHKAPFAGLKLHGLYSHPFATGKSFFTNEPLAHPKSIGLPQGHPPLTAFLGAPLVSKGKTIGVIAVANREGGYTQKQAEALEMLSPAIVQAFQHKRAEQGRERLIRLSETLNRLNSAAAATMDVDEIMQKVTTEGAQALGCDAAGILLSEDDRWVLRYLDGLPSALIGTSINGDEMPEVIRAAETGQPVVIPDVLGAGVGSGMIKKFKLGAVVAVPLVVRDKPIGVIGFNYSKAARFSEAQIDFARKLASLAAMAMENIRLYEAQREIAETLQEALLTMPESLPGVAFGHLYESATEAARVGGDFYDLFELEHGRVGVIIGDVAGKGLEAAAMTTLVKGAVKAYAFEGMFPAGVMAKTNDIIIKTTPERSFVTTFFGILDKAGGQLTYCCAGHPPAYILKADGTVAELESGRPVVGVFPNISYQDKSLILLPGERLVLYTDGITEARRGAKFFGEERLRRAIKKSAKVPVEKVPSAILQEVSDYTGGVFADDFALLALSLPKSIKKA